MFWKMREGAGGARECGGRGQFFWYRKKIPKNQTGDYLLNTDVEHSKILSILSEIAVRVEGPLTKP